MDESERGENKREGRQAKNVGEGKGTGEELERTMISSMCATETFRETPGSQRTLRPISLALSVFLSGTGDSSLLSPSEIEGLLTYKNEQARVLGSGARGRPERFPPSLLFNARRTAMHNSLQAMISIHLYQQTLNDSSVQKDEENSRAAMFKKRK